ncbi:hypothetical protein N657DRAFT_670458 [Parathielavia appendiculata]|uniref:Uncharacterized protein n=1 Tax=Parathielavia appendiculata TaxID=2587402 RepID=A0AAN6Z6V6_9PEZI|nr:hypothetical protein N657DRAFT_670458 [Parathielavia appendiculata]
MPSSNGKLDIAPLNNSVFDRFLATEHSNCTVIMQRCLEFFCVLGPNKADEPPPTPPTRASPQGAQVHAQPPPTTITDPSPMGLITMTYPDAKVNQRAYPLGRVPERHSSRNYHHHHHHHHNNNNNNGGGNPTNHRTPTKHPLASIDEVLEKTIGNPSEKDFAAESIAVRDFGAEAAARHKRKRLHEEGWETPGYDHEAESSIAAKDKGKEFVTEKWKGKGKEVVRRTVLEDSVNGEEVLGDDSDDSGAI